MSQAKRTPMLPSRSRKAVRAALPFGAVCLFGAVASVGGCIQRGYPLGPAGQVDVLADVAGSLFATDTLDAQGKPTGPRQSPYSTGIRLYLTENSEAAFEGFVDVRVEPSEALVLSSAQDEDSDQPTCVPVDGAFRCYGSREGYARFIAASNSDWSGTATIIISWADRREEHEITVLPAGLPDDATNFAFIVGGLNESDRVLATFTALDCSIGPISDSSEPKWRPGEIRVREAFVRAKAPPDSPNVVENAPVIVESLHSEAALSMSKDCADTERMPRLRVLLDASGQSNPFYLCFSDIGGEPEFAVTSGQLAISPDRKLQVDPEPRLLRVRTIESVAEVGSPIELFEVTAYNADRQRVAMPVDLHIDNDQVLVLSQASVTLNDEGSEPTTLAVLPKTSGSASLHVTPRLFNSPDCVSEPVEVIDPLN